MGIYQVRFFVRTAANSFLQCDVIDEIQLLRAQASSRMTQLEQNYLLERFERSFKSEETR